MNRLDAREMLAWRYLPPYDFYNMVILDNEIDAHIAFYIDRKNGYYSIYNEQGDFTAFCNFGFDAQVFGGDYSQDALDIGMGLRPNLTGNGQGKLFASNTLAFAKQLFRPNQYRVTVAEFNRRALHLWQALGFSEIHRFANQSSGLYFRILTMYEE